MVKLTLTNKQRRAITIATAVLAALMLADVLYQVGMHVAWRRWLPETATAQSPSTQPADTQPADEAKKKKPPKPPEIHAAIKKRNIFMQVKKESHGLKLTGVIGRIALFNKGGIEEGKSGHGVKVVSIKDYKVTIEYKGKTEVMKLFSGSGSSKPSSDKPPEQPKPEPPTEDKDKKPDPAPTSNPTTISAASATPAVPEAIRKALDGKVQGLPAGSRVRVIDQNGERKVIIETE